MLADLLTLPLPTLREEAQRVRLARFGRTVTLFAPLYISNRCINACRYCDFATSHHTLARTTLSPEEIRREGEAIAATGIRALGLAFLMGLRDWHDEVETLAAHARELQKRCWRARLQFAFPRFCPVEGGFKPLAPVGDEDLERIMLAFRIAFPEASITLSTRESAPFRDRMARLTAPRLLRRSAERMLARGRL